MANSEFVDSGDVYVLLKIIKGLTFTCREIDVIACILGGRKAKKIALLLSIAPRTVENHIHNIMQKLDCSSQDNIIDFIEKSGHAVLIKKHYSNIIIRTNFESALKKISTSMSSHAVPYGRACLMIYNKENKDILSLINRFKSDLKIVGITSLEVDEVSRESTLFVDKKDIHDVQSVIYFTSRASIEQVQVNNQGLIIKTGLFNNVNRLLSKPIPFLVLRSNEEARKEGKSNGFVRNDQFNFEYLSGDEKNYYLLFFEILKKIVHLTNVLKIIQEFKKEYEAINDPFSIETLQRNNEKLFKSSFLTKSWILLQSPNKLVLLAGAFCFIICVGLVSFYVNKEENRINFGKKETIQRLKIDSGKPYRWNLPRQDHEFVGRVNNLGTLRNQLEQKGKAAGSSMMPANALAISACAGLGGIGKTQLAIEYAVNTTHPYTVIAWFPAENLYHLQQKYVEFAEFLGYSAKETSMKETIAYVKQWLTDHPGWLLIYDNVNSYDEIKTFLPEQGGNIILTSRQKVWPTKFKIVDIDVMNEEDAILLLKSLIKNKFETDNTEELKEVVKLLGYLPLAIAQAGATIQQSQISISEYLRLYKSYEQEMLTSKTIPESSNTLPVATTWNISLAGITKEVKKDNEPPYALNLLMACSYMAPEKISKSLLLTWFKEAYPNVAAPELVLTNTLAKLWKYSLISIDHREYISVHRLVQTVLRYQHKEVVKEKELDYPPLTLEWYRILLNAVHKEFDSKTDIAEDELRQQALLPHLQSVVQYYELNWSELESDKIQPSLTDVTEDLGLVFYRLGISKSAATYFENALKMKEQYYGKSHLNITRSLIGLGMVYRTLGEAGQAKVLLERALNIQEKHYESNHIALALTLSNLGMCYKDMGDLKRAKELMERALSIQESHYGKNHWEVAKTLNYLSNCYGYLGNHEAQMAMSDRALKIFKKYYRSEHPDIAVAYTCKAYAYQALGDLKQAKENLELALKIREKHFGKKHQRVARVNSYLAGIYRELGEPKRAIELAEEALLIKEEYYRENHPEIAKTLLQLGGAYADLGEFEKAKSKLLQTLKMTELHYGIDHSEVAKVLVELVPVVKNLNDPQGAIVFAKRAHAIFLNSYGNENKYTINSLNLLNSLQIAVTGKTVINNQEHKLVSNKHFDKKVLIISTGLAGVGKSKHINALKNRLSNSVHIDKDTISAALMPNGVDLASPEYKAIKDRVYDVMLRLVDLNVQQKNSVILEGYFGPKLTSPLLKNYLMSKNFETKVLYFHCSGAKQKERLMARASTDPEAKIRDKDKLDPEKFDKYRLEHVTQHMTELSQVPHLLIDTEKEEDLDKNIEKIIQFIEAPNNPEFDLKEKTNKRLTIGEAMLDAKTFKTFLRSNSKP